MKACFVVTYVGLVVLDMTRRYAKVQSQALRGLGLVLIVQQLGGWFFTVSTDFTDGYVETTVHNWQIVVHMVLIFLLAASLLYVVPATDDDDRQGQIEHLERQLQLLRQVSSQENLLVVDEQVGSSFATPFRFQCHAYHCPLQAYLWFCVVYYVIVLVDNTDAGDYANQLNLPNNVDNSQTLITPHFINLWNWYNVVTMNVIIVLVYVLVSTRTATTSFTTRRLAHDDDDDDDDRQTATIIRSTLVDDPVGSIEFLFTIDLFLTQTTAYSTHDAKSTHFRVFPMGIAVASVGLGVLFVSICRSSSRLGAAVANGGTGSYCCCPCPTSTSRQDYDTMNEVEDTA